MKKLFPFLIITLFAIKLFSQDAEVKKLSLKEAQDFALNNSADVKNARLDVLIAKKKVWETTAIGLPQLNASIAYQYLPNVPEASFPTIYPVYDNQGILIDISYEEQPIPLGVESAATIDITLSQLVFSGEYLVGLQASRTFKALSAQSLKKSEQDIKELVANTYYMILVLEENNRVLDSTFKSVERTAFEINQMYEQGFVEETDADQINLTKASLKSSVISVERQLDMAYSLLKFQIGMDDNQEIELTQNLDEILGLNDLGSLSSSEFNLQNNINYQLLTTQETLTELDLKRTKSTFLPTVAAFYNHQEQTQVADFNFFIPDIIGVNINVPIFSSWQRMSQVQQKQMELEKVQNSKTQASQGLELEFTQALTEYSNALDKYLVEKDNRDLAKKIYDRTLIKYREGISSSMDLTQAQSQYLTTQSSYFNATLTLLQSKNKLEKLLNQY
jgi:outer membrane protein